MTTQAFPKPKRLKKKHIHSWGEHCDCEYCQLEVCYKCGEERTKK